jgi:hypothetical protein
MTSELRHPSNFDKIMIVIVSNHTQNRTSSRKRASTALRTAQLPLPPPSDASL